VATEHWECLIQQASTRPNRSQRKSLAEIDDMLRPGEAPLALVFGQAENASGKDTIGVLVLTTERMLYRGRLVGQHGTSSYRLDQIDSVSSTSGLLLGSLDVSVAGSGFRLDKANKAEAAEFARRARDQMSAYQQQVAIQPLPPPAAPTAQPVGLIADELRKLAELRDAGVLTSEEFNQQKARLLGS
jgi:hypothetical protein